MTSAAAMPLIFWGTNFQVWQGPSAGAEISDREELTWR